jgi:hypothetical protein
MSYTVWRPIKQVYCEKVGRMVALEARLVYPAELLPDGPPRVLEHRCSMAMDCNLIDTPSCRWAGTLPGHDPFAD